MTLEHKFNSHFLWSSIIFICMLLPFSSCKKEVIITEKDIETGGYPVVIEFPAGELIFDHFLPAIGNTSKLTTHDGDTVELITLSPRKSAGSVQNVIPIALFKYQTKQQVYRVIVSIPFREEDRIIQATTLAELSVLYGNVKRIIEEWYSGQAGVSNIETLGWENENQAIKLLLTHTNDKNQ